MSKPSQAAFNAAGKTFSPGYENGYNVEEVAKIIDEEFAPAIEYVKDDAKSPSSTSERSEHAKEILKQIGIPLEEVSE